MADEQNPFDQPAGFTDLETKADDIYQLAVGLADSCTSVSEMTKAYDLALKAIRLRAELREKDQRPAQIEALRKDIERVERTIKQHHARIDDGEGEKAPREGPAPSWRQ